LRQSPRRTTTTRRMLTDPDARDAVE
jgi:hypothetical protein